LEAIDEPALSFVIPAEVKNERTIDHLQEELESSKKDLINSLGNDATIYF
jgi:hypothetical protein